jgi:oxygen-dependent protoporphyrinogen oxidase
MKRIAIIGGGISGLSAAFTLERQRQAGLPLEFVLFEASPRFGGVILTERMENCTVEAGPDSFLTEKPWASELCQELGIADQLIGSNDFQRRTYISVNGKLIPIPDGLAFMVPTKLMPAALSPLFSLRTKIRMAREWFYRPGEIGADESVGSFVKRHYGEEMVERLADPLLSGIYGGDASDLSLRAVLPRFADMQARNGSLGKTLIANRKEAMNTVARPVFTTLKDGMRQLVSTILSHLSASRVRSNNEIRSLQARERGWLVSSNANVENFDGVIITIPTHAAARLLEDSHPKLASELRDIRYSSSVTVSLVYDEKVRANLPEGFGYLVPRAEGKRVLAATFVHNKFPNRAPDDRALIRCFLGGTRDETVLDLSEDEILGIIRAELRQTLRIEAEPLFARVYKWKAAMAQYNVGHLERLERIERLRLNAPGLFLAGNAYKGIGIPDCVRSGKEAASQAIEAVGLGDFKTVATS